jgi:hypothetical protein
MECSTCPSRMIGPSVAFVSGWATAWQSTRRGRAAHAGRDAAHARIFLTAAAVYWQQNTRRWRYPTASPRTHVGDLALSASCPHPAVHPRLAHTEPEIGCGAYISRARMKAAGDGLPLALRGSSCAMREHFSGPGTNDHPAIANMFYMLQ